MSEEFGVQCKLIAWSGQTLLLTADSPVYLIELSPTHLRTLFYSLTYQLGNLASSASATIEAIIGERFPLPDGPDGEERYNYGKVIGPYCVSFLGFVLPLTQSRYLPWRSVGLHTILDVLGPGDDSSRAR